MTAYATPGVYLRSGRPGRPVGALRTDVAGFVGIAARGPVDQPVGIDAWEAFLTVFGGLVPNAHLAYAVRGFFENGGRRCHVVRVAQPARVTTTREPAAAQPPDGASSLVVSTAGFVPGALVTVRGAQAAVARLVVGVDAAARRLVWAEPLPDALARRPLELETGAGAAAATLLDAGGAPALEVQAGSPGAWGNALSVTVTRSSPAATRTAGPQPPDRGSSVVESVDGMAAGTLVRLTQAAGAAPSHRVVAGVEPVTRTLRWDAPLDGAFDSAQPALLETVELGLTVALAGRVEEVFGALSPVAGTPAFLGSTVSAASRHVEVLGVGAIASAGRATLALAGGRDGVAGIAAGDLIRGVRALGEVDEVALVAVPDAFVQPRAATVTAAPPPAPVDPCLPAAPAEVAPPAPPALVERAPSLAGEDRARIQQVVVAECELRRDRFALLDAPPDDDVETWRRRFDSRHAALYHPWLLVLDPLRSDGRLLRALPPSGHVAGVIARVDNAVGAHKPPANELLSGAHGTSIDVSAELQGQLNPSGVNCIRTLPGRGLRVYGARTVSSDPSWRFVNVRRLLTMIEEAIEQSLQWAVFEPNDVYLRESVRLAVSGYLERLWQTGALAGAGPEEAFFVRCDEENNPPAVIDLGRLVAEVGVAAVRPAEFVVFEVGRTRDQLELTEA